MLKYSRAVCALAFATCALAQDFRATLSGTVNDPAGAPVPNCTVRAIKSGTNVRTETHTNDLGLYNLPFLDPGQYTVFAEAPGFKETRRPNITLNVADKLNLPLTLQLGDVTEQVTVTGEQELVQTTSASRGLVFDPQKMQEYPLNGGQSYMLMQLTPGVLFTQQQFGSSGFSGTRGWDVNGSYTINGGRTGTNQFLLQGTPISSDGTWNISVTRDAIQEFKVLTNTYDSQYGRSGGGWVSTILKSGSNGVHGTAFDYWRNTVLDSNTTQNNRLGASRGKRNQHQFGGTVGFPIRKDKDFLFLSFEGWREVVPFPVVASTVPVTMRNGSGFTQFNQKIYDPQTSALCSGSGCLSGGIYQRQPFPGNAIPANRISPIARNILALYPLPNQITAPTLTQNFTATDSVGRYRYNQPLARYDKIISSQDRFSAAGFWQEGFEFRNQNGFPPPAQTGNINSSRTTFGTTLNYTRVLSPTLVFDVRASHNRFYQNFPDVSDNAYTWDKLGIRNIPTVPNFPNRLAPRIQINDFNDILGNTRTNFASRDQLWFSPSLAQSKGRHNLKYGFEWALITRGTRNEGRSSGQLTFDRFWTQQYSGRGQGSTDGSPVASLLLGLPGSGLIDYNDTFLRREPYLAWYVQDDYKVNSRLVLNLGLRYDIQFGLTELRNRLNAGFDPGGANPLSGPVLDQWRTLQAQYNATNPRYAYPAPPSALTGGLLFAGVNGAPERVYETDWTNVQPRVGAAYRVANNTVIRGGFAVMHRTATQGNLSSGFSQQTAYQRSLDGDRTPSAQLTGPYSLEDPWPNGLVVPAGASAGLLTSIGNGISYDSRKRPVPRTYQWSFDIEQGLPGKMVAEVAYVGGSTYLEPIALQLGDIPYNVRQQGIADPNSLNNPVPNPFFGILPRNSTFGASPTINASNLFRAFPLFNGVTNNTSANGAVRYHGLQTRLEKRSSSTNFGDVTFVLAYTFGKQLERFLRNNNNFFNERQITQVTDIDQTHAFSFNGIYSLPFGKGRAFAFNSGWTEAFAGGWNIDWIYTFYSGQPVAKPDAVFSCGRYEVEQQTLDRWFNNTPSCYTQRAPFTLREVEQRFSTIRNDAAPQLNLALVKKFAIAERYSLEVRGESFNITNSPIYAPPNTSFTDPQFGKLPLQQYNFPRQVQLGLKLRF